MSAYSGLLNQTATIYPKASRDYYGKPSFGAGVVVACRFDQISSVKLMPTQQETIINAKMNVEPDVVVAEHDKVVGPDANSYRVVEINQVPDRFGDQHHIEIGLQLWSI